MKLSDFDYDLPERLIAQTPLPTRTASRLLILEKDTGEVHHAHFVELNDWLPANSILALNHTRVIPARLLGEREGTGGKAEVLLVRHLEHPHEPLRGDGWGRWECLINTSKKVRAGQVIRLEGDATVTIESVYEGGVRAVLLEGPGTLAALLVDAGSAPLPPYIRRPEGPDDADAERYQTVYAETAGAVAAPTAGLHFTPELLSALEDSGHVLAPLTLHVGPGTFLPVRSENLDEHVMHVEPYEIPKATAERLNARGPEQRVVAVGTTTCRALESAGSDGRVQAGPGNADLFIRPGTELRVVDALITNFHLPRSTLLMLVSALAGREHVLAAYAEAIREEYRFYSYGDAMLIR